MNDYQLKLIFLDVDGVGNQHIKFDNGYCGIEPKCAENLNYILDEQSEAKLVISSAWRYFILSASMNIQGFENLLLTHGIKCWGRVQGHTKSDEWFASQLGSPRPDFNNLDSWHQWIKEHGVEIRRLQIKDYLRETEPHSYVILDDIDLNMDNQIVTSKYEGLTKDEAERAIILLNAKA